MNAELRFDVYLMDSSSPDLNVETCIIKQPFFMMRSISSIDLFPHFVLVSVGHICSIDFQPVRTFPPFFELREELKCTLTRWSVGLQ